MGIIYFIAFVSLWVQIDGLVGSRGIAPATQYMDLIHNWSRTHSVWGAVSIAPTLCWFNTSDQFLHFLCGGGTILSIFVILGLATAPSLAVLWLLYLSLCVVGEPFLNFQWDALLLETGFLAIFFAPRQLLPGLTREAPPSRTALWLLRWLLFRLMFASGVVKLATGDKTWWGLTALTYHYETQPLPTWIGWYAHQLPLWFQKFSCGFMFTIELGMPFLIFAPRRLRLLACGSIVTLMTLIALTGNYCFFNLLAVTLCVLLLDDALLLAGCRGASVKRRIGVIIKTALHRSAATPPWRWPCWITVPSAAVVLLVTTMTLTSSFREPISWPGPMVSLFRTLAPLRSFNGYGLFAMMTTARPEIIIEGSNDGQTWQTYEFKYKPGDPTRRPAFVAPYQPRLDWQMWFEALNVMNPRYEPSSWFINFCVRLLQGQPEVLALLKTNPFPNSPPRYLRATVYNYHFTNFTTRRETGTWWRRDLIGPYCPTLSLPKPLAQ